MTSLRIGIDARAAAEVPAGRGRYVRELLRALAERNDPHRYLLYVRKRWDEPLDERFSWHARELPEAVWHLHAARAASRECDVFLATNSYVTPWFLRIPTALVVHDLIPFQKDIRANRRAALIERLTIRRALGRAALIFCDSKATRRDLLRLAPRVEPKATVAQLAADARFAQHREAAELDSVRRRHGLSKPFVLCTGTLEPRKNLVRLIEAFAALPADLPQPHELVLVGPQGWEMEEILLRARTSRAMVRVLGYVSEDELAALYRLCEVFAYPSLYEGFGLPVIEAMSAGAAVLTSNVSSLPEVGGDAVAYIDPWSADDIRHGLERLLRSPGERAKLKELAQRRASAFSWSRTAGHVLSGLEKLGAEAAGSGV